MLAPSFCSFSSQESAFRWGGRCRIADAHCPTGAFTLRLKIDSRSKSRFLVSTSCHLVHFLLSSASRFERCPQEETTNSSDNLRKPERTEMYKTKKEGGEKERDEEREEILVPRYRRKPRSLPPICYCNLHYYGWDMDNGILGFTERTRWEGGEKGTLSVCSALRNRHASAFDRCSKYCRSQFVMLYVKKKMLKYYLHDVCFCDLFDLITWNNWSMISQINGCPYCL